MIFDKLGITPYINAHDTYTVYGGSRMADNTLAAMNEAAAHFVDIQEMQRILGEKIALMTKNQGAYITNGASGGLLLAACICMSKGSMYRYRSLPDTKGTDNEIIVMRCQRNAYDKAIAASGASIIEIGDADETLEEELEGVINSNTAAIFYFASALYERASLPLCDVIRIARQRGIPVVVDAAAQLPPVENLWRFRELGADLVIFSGGKTLCGPQDSGLLLGRKDMIEDCVRFGAPVHGICRSSKVSRESMAGLYTAVENYLSLDHKANEVRLMDTNLRIAEAMEGTGNVKAQIVKRGPVGQNYPRVFGYLTEQLKAEDIQITMRKKHIYIGAEKKENAIYVSPLNLNEQEIEDVIIALIGCL